MEELKVNPNRQDGPIRKRKYTMAEFDENQRDYRFKIKSDIKLEE